MMMARLIDADDYKRILEGWIADLPSSGFDETADTVCTVIFDCICQLNDMPTIEAKPVKHGKWIFNEHQAFNEKSYFCSECTEGESDYGTDNYCPNCGARMDGN